MSPFRYRRALLLIAILLGAPLSAWCAEAYFDYVIGDPDPDPAIFNIIHDGGSVPFTTASNAAWLTVTPAAGSTPNYLNVAVHPKGLPEGNYFSTITIGPGCCLYIYVYLTVSKYPEYSLLSLSQFGVNFQAAYGTNPAPYTMTVKSTGAPLTYTADAGRLEWLSVSGPNTTSENGLVKVSGTTPSNFTISVNSRNLAPGTYRGLVQILSPNAAIARVDVPIFLTVTAPKMVLSSSFIDLAYVQGGALPPPQTISISTDPVSSLPYTAAISSASPWLAISSTNGSAPGSLRVSINPANLAVGTWGGIIEFRYVADQSLAATYTVNLQVVPTRFTISPDLPSTFTYDQGGTIPPAQTVTVTTGNVNLPFNIRIASGSSWLSVTPSGTANVPSNLSISVKPQNLAVGTYTDSIILTAVNGALTQTIPITLVVHPSSLLKSDPASVVIDYTPCTGESPPLSRILAITADQTTQIGTVQLTPFTGQWFAGAILGSATPTRMSLLFYPQRVDPGTYTGKITMTPPVGGALEIPVSMTTHEGHACVTDGGVLNGASFGTTIAPSTWLSIFGIDLSGAPGPGRGWRDADFVNGTLPLSLDGVSVKINNKPAPIAFVSPTQVNMLAPDDNTTGPVPLEITTPKAKGQVTVKLSPVAPAIFTNYDTVLAFHTDGTRVAFPPDGQPARIGETILVFGTGFGKTDPPRVAARSMDPAPLAEAFAVTLGSKTAASPFGGIIGPGLYQFNVEIPDFDGTGGFLPFAIKLASGASTQANVFLAVTR